MIDTSDIEKSLEKLEALIGVTFLDRIHLLTAVTHRSYLNEHKEAKQGHNERYEFLGDAVLELVITDFLFNKYPEKPEGELTAIRAALVNTVSLSEVASKLDLSEFLLLSKGEEKDTGRARQYILANTFESIIGSIYIDRGYEIAKEFIGRNLFDKTEPIVAKRLWQDAKSRFQELAQEHTSITPSYETLNQTGPDHDRVFTVGVFLGGEKIAEGRGRSKQEAEQSAAEAGLTAKGW
ncbi:MAG: ribonuclease III [Candidatus Kaiserbacteria bacterium]|nr:ribonuclease III [Candidatus Kaiserbacteria bacterium]